MLPTGLTHEKKCTRCGTLNYKIARTPGTEYLGNTRYIQCPCIFQTNPLASWEYQGHTEQNPLGGQIHYPTHTVKLTKIDTTPLGTIPRTFLKTYTKTKTYHPTEENTTTRTTWEKEDTIIPDNEWWLKPPATVDCLQRPRLKRHCTIISQSSTEETDTDVDDDNTDTSTKRRGTLTQPEAQDTQTSSDTDEQYLTQS